tara:strand:+ start:160 stop:630 length:471 start_codon:yes stop_codon:yes gene_type:complete
MSLEVELLDNLRQGNEVNLERALLIVSGCQTEEEIAAYQQKIGWIQQRFHDSLRSYAHLLAEDLLERDIISMFQPPENALEMSADELAEYFYSNEILQSQKLRATFLNDFLRSEKPKITGKHLNFTPIIDAQINGLEYRGGPCLESTILYVVLAIR